MSIAELIKRLLRAAGRSEWSACSMSAATPAAAGAAAEVPKKFGKLSASPSSEPKKLVLPPSGAVISGVARVTEIGLPAASKKIFVGPAEEKLSMTGGLTPKAGVCA